MIEFFREGGFGMYPTALFGLLLVASGVLFLRRPERKYTWLMSSLGFVTVSSGLLSFVTGLMMTFNYLDTAPADRRMVIAAAGCAESMHNLVLALQMVLVAAILASIGAFRASRATQQA